MGLEDEEREERHAVYGFAGRRGDVHASRACCCRLELRTVFWEGKNGFALLALPPYLWVWGRRPHRSCRGDPFVRAHDKSLLGALRASGAATGKTLWNNGVA